MEEWEENHSPVILVGEQHPVQKRNSNYAATSLALGILSIVLVFVFYVSFVEGLIGLILGIISLSQGRDGRGMAIGGCITSGIGMLISLVVGFLWLIAVLF